MDSIIRTLSLTLAVFLMMTLIWNLNRRLPRFPWDPLVSKFGYLFYLPVISAVVLSMVISIFVGNFIH